MNWYPRYYGSCKVCGKFKSHCNCRRLLLSLVLLFISGCTTLATDKAAYGCQAADASTTLYALHRGLIETNPLMKGLLATTGAPGFIAFKLGVAWLVTQIPSEPVKVGVNAVGCGAAIWNLSLIL